MHGIPDTRIIGDPLPEPRRVEKTGYLTLEQAPGVRRWRIDGRLAGILRDLDGWVITFSMNPSMNREQQGKVLDSVRANRFMTDEEWQIFVVEAGYGS